MTGAAVDDAMTARVHETVGAVDGCLGRTFAVVETVREQVLAAATGAASAGRGMRVADLAGLEPLLREHLAPSAQPRLAGLGFVPAVGALGDRPRGLEWVRRDQQGSVSRLEPDLDPDSLGYYDFTTTDWFRRPLATGARSVVGPYVDVSGTDEYVVTVTVPVALAGRALGVCGADLRLGDLFDVVMPTVRGLDADAALVNADDRVMVSSSPRWLVGSLLPAGDALLTRRCRLVPWRVVVHETRYGSVG